jgi:PAS domain S-box-containing protein/diguanylate cyclase (GGDEF)-like protein
VALAAHSVRAPAALLALVGDGGHHVKAIYGDVPALGALRAAPPSPGPWAQEVAAVAPRVVTDSTVEGRRDAGAAYRIMGVRAYVGVPVLDPAGRSLGALCVVDRAPRAWLATDVEALASVATAVGTEIALRRERSERARLERAQFASAARFRQLLQTLRSAAVVLDPSGTVTLANDAFLELTGWSHDEAFGSDWFEQFAPGNDAAREQFAELIASDDIPPHFTSEVVTHGGGRRLIAWDSAVIRDAAGAIVGVARIGQDVTDRRTLEKRLASLAEHDELTGLLNRRGFRRMVAQGMKSAPRAGRRDAVLRVELDGPGDATDANGGGDADDAASVVATILQGTIREADIAARFGGRSFAVYAVGLRLPGEGAILAARLDAALAVHNADAEGAGRPYALVGRVGVVEIEFGQEVDDVLARAEAALADVHRVPSASARDWS